MVKAVIFDMFETLVTHYKSPLYFGSEIARDLGMDKNTFLKAWNKYEDDRTLGKIDLEDVISEILKQNEMYSADLVDYVVKKRIVSKSRCFETIYEDIVKMLELLKLKK